MDIKRWCICVAVGLLQACGQDGGMVSEYDRMLARFLGDIGGQLDETQFWRTAVALHVSVFPAYPVQVWAYSIGDESVTLYDRKEVDGSGKVTLTVPQGLDRTLQVACTSATGKVVRQLTLSGDANQSLGLDISSLQDNSVSWGGRSAVHPSLYGASVLGNGSYIETDIKTWNDVMHLVAQESVDQSLNGEIVNYELVSNGKFEISFLSGCGETMAPRVLGYYYHSPGTYSDVQFQEIAETHLYDYLDGYAKLQYQLDGKNRWYDANYDMNDGPDDDSKANSLRRGDDAYNIVKVWKRYGDRVTRVRGMGFPVDVPEGMHLGFYLSIGGEYSQEQQTKVIRLGMNENHLPVPYEAYNFSAQAFNHSATSKKTHRSWIRKMPEYMFMGMENQFGGGDLDCNDVVFGVTATEMDMVIPDVVTPDVDHLVITDQLLSWTIAFEDVGKGTDFDFNDAVIRVVPDIEKQQACVSVLAAGSEDRMWLHYDGPDGDINLGEIHELLGKGLTKVNTLQSRAATPFVEVGCVDWPDDYTMNNDAHRFYIEVKHGTCEECTSLITLAHVPGNFPQAICVAGDWRWPREGVSINEAYVNFKDWAKDQTDTNTWDWYQLPRMDTYVEY